VAEVIDPGLEELALTWTGRAVDVSHIEAELSKLRYLAAGEPSGGEGFALRASLLNLVVYAENEEAAGNASRIITELAGQHPSRALIVIAKPSNDESRIDAQLAAHCHISPGVEQQVCCEEVTLTVAGRAANHLHSVIIPLLVPDLPVYLWWTGPLPHGEHLFEDMVQTADRFIVDSALFMEQGHDLLRLAHLCDDEPGCSIGDLTWERLAAWRDVLLRHSRMAQVGRYLEHTWKAEVTFAGADRPISVQAYLMSAWLARHFGWHTRSVSAYTGGWFVLRHEERDMTIGLRGEDYGGVPPGSLVSLRLHCETADGASAFVSLERSGEMHLSVRVQTPESTIEERVRLDTGDQADLLMRELEASVHETEYTQVLRLALPLILAAGRA
jgi:glucose-6-phosphate dehydrogenase assembly protein OpcA